jgi:[ribosomal protein S5]-alanine N-acetyltransferase
VIFVPTLNHGDVYVRSIRPRDARQLGAQLKRNRSWLEKWEATIPGDSMLPSAGTIVRSLLRLARHDQAAPFVIEHQGEVVGQITVSGLSFGSLASGSIGYWISEDVAGRGITPKAVALVADWCFTGLGIHRIEICIRPENESSLRIVRKLGMRYEGLRRRYIHIDGDWRDHFCFAVTIDEVPGGLLSRLTRGTANESLADIPDADRRAAGTPLR